MEELQMLWQTLMEEDIPKPIFFIGFILSNVITGWATRAASKDKNKSEILTKAMQRQSELDEHQKELFSQLNAEIARLKKEIEESKEDARAREENNMQLFDKNQQLLAKIGDLELALERQEYECEKKKNQLKDNKS